MNEMEMQLSRLFNAAVGEPPHQVTAHAARRQAFKRRIVTCASVTAALVIAGSIGLAVSANAIAPHRVADSRQTLTRPKFYFDADVHSVKRHAVSELVVRSVATGAITGRLNCPGAGPAAVEGTAATADQTFFIDCTVLSKNQAQLGIRIYRFKVGATGRVSGFGLVPGGNLPGLRGANLAVTADGSLLAIDLANVRKGPISEIFVINTKTGAHAVWRADTLRGGITFHPEDLSFALGGHELAVFGSDTCAGGAGSHCWNPGQEMVAVNPAAKGGNLSSGREIFSQGQVGAPRKSYVADAYLSPDGKTVIASIAQKSGTQVVELSAGTAKTLRTLLKEGPDNSAGTIEVDQSGRFILYQGLHNRVLSHHRINHRAFNGWIDHGKLRPLRPVHEFVFQAAW
jgi:hypothetical protein